MDLEKFKTCPVCKNKISIIYLSTSRYQRFNCSGHLKGSIANLPDKDNFIYESIIYLNNNFQLDLRYSENKKNKLYATAKLYDNSYTIIKNILIPEEYINSFDINQIYKYSQKILNNISFI